MTTEKRRMLIAAIPLILVNLTAFSGQFGYIRDHVHWILPGQLMLAVSLESIALFLTAMAHEALMSEDTAYGLRILSYGVAGLIALMNLSHYSPGFRVTFLGLATALCSLASPILWGIYGKRNSRDALKAKGLIEPRAVRLGLLRWLFWPKRALPVYRLAVWNGENRPDAAIAAWETERERTPAAPLAVPLPQPERTPLETARTKADAVKVALAELGATLAASEVASWLRERGWDVTPAHVRKVRSEIARNSDATGATILALPRAAVNGDSQTR